MSDSQLVDIADAIQEQLHTDWHYMHQPTEEEEEQASGGGLQLAGCGSSEGKRHLDDDDTLGNQSKKFKSN